MPILLHEPNSFHVSALKNMPHIHIIKANVLAGLLSGVIAPVIWPLVVFFTEGKFPTWSSYPLAALSIFAINKPTIASASGLIMAIIVFFAISIINNYPSLSQTWPLAAFFSCIGAFCGATASILARTNKRMQPDQQSAARFVGR